MKFIILYYIKSFKKNFLKDAKNTFILSIILATVILLAITPSLDNDNQTRFLARSKYSVVSLDDFIKSDSNAYQLYFTYASAHSSSTENEVVGGVLADRTSNLELYIELENTTYDDISPFNEKNLYKKSKVNYGEFGIGLTYNTISLLNIGLDDDIYVDFFVNRNEEIVMISKKYNVQYIYKSKFGDLEDKAINESSGLGVITQTDLTKELNGWTLASFLIKSLDAFKESDNVTKQFQISLIKTNDIFYNILISSGFFSMGFLLVLLIFLRDINFNINRRKRNIAIVSIEGAEKKILIWTFMFNSLVVFITSSFVSSVLYKFVLVKYILKSYMSIPIFLTALSMCLLIGAMITIISYFRIKNKLSKMNEIQTINAKEGIL